MLQLTVSSARHEAPEVQAALRRHDQVTREAGLWLWVDKCFASRNRLGQAGTCTSARCVYHESQARPNALSHRPVNGEVRAEILGELVRGSWGSLRGLARRT